MPNAEQLTAYSADLHIHSSYSDGLHSPNQIINQAVKKSINICALTDHHTLKGWDSFWSAAEQHNKYVALLAILGVEVNFKEGHVLVLLPNRDNADNFRSHFRKNWGKKEYAQDKIPQYIDEFGAICIFPHPEFPYINSIRYDSIRSIIAGLDAYQISNVGLEIYNWMTQVFFWRYQLNSHCSTQLCDEYNLAKFSNSDSHAVQTVGSCATKISLNSLTHDAFVKAVQKRQTIPHQFGSAKNLDLLSASHSVLRHYCRQRINKIKRKLKQKSSP